MPLRRKAFREKHFYRHLMQLRSDPIWARDQPFTRSAWFGWRLLYETKQEINANAERGMLPALEAFDLFDFVRALRTISIPVVRRSNCMAVTARGLLAEANRRLGRLGKALDHLEQAILEGNDCGSCGTENLRRRGLIYATMGRIETAETDSLEALSRARGLSCKSDHNLNGNSMAAAMLGCHVAYFFAGRYQDAARAAEEALAVINPGLSPDLYKAALRNIAAALTELGGEADLRRADACLAEAYGFFSNSSIGRNAERATLDFLYGQLRIRQGHEDEGRRLIVKAQLDFVWLKMPREAVIATTVLARWHAANGARWETENAVTDLLVNRGDRRSWHPAFKALPGEVLRELERVIRLARRGSFEAVFASIGRVRELLKADQIMPCLL